MITDKSKQLYLDWFKENEIPFEQDVVINGVKVFILPTNATKKIAFLIRGETPPYTFKEARKLLKKAHYYAHGLKETDKENIGKHVIMTKNHLKGIKCETTHYKKGTKVAMFAMGMTNNPTPTEQLFRDYLLTKDIFFETQVPIKGKTQWWIADFVLKKNIVLEIDGGYHNAPIQAARDRLKDEELKALGYNVIRVTNENVRNDIEKVFNLIA